MTFELIDMSDRVNTSDLASLFVQRLRDNAAIQIEGLNIICRAMDGYINATQLCKAGGKMFNDWSKIKKSNDFIRELSVSTKIFVDTLIKYEINGSTDRATWVHPQVAINIAQWISPAFDVKVSKWIYELLVCGTVTYGAERSSEAILHEQLQQLQSTINQQKLYIEKQNESLTQQYNTLVQQNDYIVQQNDYIVQQKGILVVKDDKIDQLQAEIRELIRRNEIEAKRAEESRMRMEEMYNATNKKLESTHTLLSHTSSELHQTKSILEDVAERIVPVLHDDTKMEVVLIYYLKKPEDCMFTDTFTIRGVQESGIKALERSLTSTYKKGNFKLVKAYHHTPNAIMLKAKIREWTKMVKSYRSNFKLIDCTMATFISCVDRLYENTCIV